MHRWRSSISFCIISLAISGSFYFFRRILKFLYFFGEIGLSYAFKKLSPTCPSLSPSTMEIHLTFSRTLNWYSNSDETGVMETIILFIYSLPGLGYSLFFFNLFLELLIYLPVHLFSLYLNTRHVACTWKWPGKAFTMPLSVFTNLHIHLFKTFDPIIVHAHPPSCLGSRLPIMLFILNFYYFCTFLPGRISVW